MLYMLYNPAPDITLQKDALDTLLYACELWTLVGSKRVGQWNEKELDDCFQWCQRIETVFL